MTNNKKQVDQNIIDDLNRLAPSCTKVGVKLSNLSWYKIGGFADVIVEPNSVQMVSELVRYLNANNVLYTVYW